MASLSEMVDLAKAQQPRNPLAEIAGHFIEGASKGYDAGHAEALKKAETLRNNPTVTDPESGKEVSLDAYIKILDVKNKLLDNANQKLLTDTFFGQVDAKDAEGRNTSLSGIASNALGAQGKIPGTDGTTTAGKIAGAVANPDSIGNPRKPSKMTMEMSGGTPTFKMEFGDPKKSTVQQISAIKSYVDSNGSPESTAAMSAVFPDGVPEWANKFMLQHTEIKQKKDAIGEAKNQARQDKLEAAYRSAQTSVRGDPSMARTESQRDASITAFNTLQNAKNSGREITQAEYYDTLGQLWKARTGAAPTDQAIRDLDINTIQGALNKKLTWVDGKPRGATSQEVVDALQNFVADSGMQADKIHGGYMKSRLKPPSGLDPDRIANVDAGRGMSFQEATGYQPEGPKKTGKAPTVSSQADYDALPKGTEYIADGKLHRKK